MILNFKLLILISYFFTQFSVATTSLKRKESKISYYKIKTLVSKIKRKNLMESLNNFVKSTRPNRFPGNKGHKKAISWLLNEVKRRNFDDKSKVFLDEFIPDVQYAQDLYKNDFKKEIEGKYSLSSPVYKKWKGFTDSMVKMIGNYKSFKGHNVVWEKTGHKTPEELIIIGAHFDTIANDPDTLKIDPNANMPGADDNGSAVVIALHLIETLSKMEFPKSIRVVFFDFEELGFLGSRAYVQKYKNDFRKKFKTYAYINLEMLGNDSKIRDKIKKHGNMKVYIRAKNEKGHQNDLKVAEELIRAGKKVSPGVQFKVVGNSFNSSDHIAFWEEGFPAVTFTQDWENDFNQNRYHTPNDFPETINFTTLYRSFKFITGSIIAWGFNIL